MPSAATKYALLREQARRVHELPTAVSLWTRKLKKLRWQKMKSIRRSEGGTVRERSREAAEEVYAEFNESQWWHYVHGLPQQLKHHNDSETSEIEWQRASKRTQRKRELLQRKRQDKEKR